LDVIVKIYFSDFWMLPKNLTQGRN